MNQLENQLFFCQEKNALPKFKHEIMLFKNRKHLPLSRLKIHFLSFFQTELIHKKNTENQLDSRYFLNYFAVCFLTDGKISVAINSMFFSI